MKLTNILVIVAVCVLAYVWWSNNQAPVQPETPVTDDPIEVIATEVPPAESAPQGRVVEYTEAEINERFATFGIEGAQMTGVTLLQDTVVIGFAVGGLQSEMRMGVQAIDGSVRIQNPQIEGLLGSLLPVDQVVTTIEDQINQRIVQQSPVTAIQIVPGAIVVTYSE